MTTRFKPGDAIILNPDWVGYVDTTIGYISDERVNPEREGASFTYASWTTENSDFRYVYWSNGKRGILDLNTKKNHVLKV